MSKSNRQEKFLELRKQFPWLVYEGYDADLGPEGLRVKYSYDLGGRYRFTPSLEIPWSPQFSDPEIIRPVLDVFLFNLGLIEMVSYWKAACPPRVIIKPAGLSEEQIAWWKKTWYHGLGEFFYLNGIQTTQDDFVQFECDPDAVQTSHCRLRHLIDAPIIPIGGGKDSVVTLELAGHIAGSLPMMMNPRTASLETAYTRGFTADRTLTVYRTIDPLLLKLNEEGFLNGHTPFSALLAFVSVLCAALTGRRFIALSNESSANEATLPGTSINHQYSKTVAFEADFREYCAAYLTPDIEYFSFLRPINELQIARLFSGSPDYFPVFRSCNAGSKTNSWCGNCAKCLFTYVILSPFIPNEELKRIFGKDLFEDPGLYPYLEELAGLSPEKPFECVGTVDEVNAALSQTIRHRGSEELPVLLKRYLEAKKTLGTEEDFRILLKKYSRPNFLPEEFQVILREALES